MSARDCDCGICMDCMPQQDPIYGGVRLIPVEVKASPEAARMGREAARKAVRIIRLERALRAGMELAADVLEREDEETAITAGIAEAVKTLIRLREEGK